ncbi:MAG: FAD-dependent monooxygenase [Pseudomonadota bacterium]
MNRVIIAGGGIAGLAASLAFDRAGWEVTVLERAPQLGEVGAGIQLSPNACKVLDWLGILPAIREHAFTPATADLRDGLSGETLLSVPLGPAAEARWHAPYLHIHRADLLSVLAKAVERRRIDLRLGIEAVRAVDQPDAVSVHLSDGSLLAADLAIGADGIRSALRAAINPDEAPRFTGQTAWRALIPAAALPGGTIPRTATVWAGAGRHLVTYYLRGGDLINLVAVLERAAWTEESWSAPGDVDALRKAFDGWHPAVSALLAAVDTCFLWGLFDRPEQVRWTSGHTALIGDAAHPMLPFMAQGAGMALEDVPVLVNAVGSGSDIPAALEAFERRRWPRVTRVLQRARANGRLFHHPPGMAQWLARTPIRLAGQIAPGLAAGQLDWLYGFDATQG